MNKRNPASSAKSATEAESTSTPEEGASDAPVAEAGGLRWVKYAGIGQARQPRGTAKQDKEKGLGKKKLSGEDITSLGSLEAELMGILWDIGKPAASMDVMEQSLYKRRAQGVEPVSFATVATTLRRLTDKGVVSTYKNAQGTPVYVPTVEREEMAARILNNVSVTLLGQSLHGLLPRLMGTLKTGGRGKGKTDASNAEEQVEVERLMQALEEAAGKGHEQAAGEVTKTNSPS